MNRKDYNAYMREYKKRRYAEKIKKWKSLLGDKCVRCGSENNLQFDHIDPAQKKFTITERTRHSEHMVLEELKKCQLLCLDCHMGDKTVREKGHVPTKNKNIHGTLSSYRYCKCALCKKANTDWNRDYKKKRKDAEK